MLKFLLDEQIHFNIFNIKNWFICWAFLSFLACILYYLRITLTVGIVQDIYRPIRNCWMNYDGTSRSISKKDILGEGHSISFGLCFYDTFLLLKCSHCSIEAVIVSACPIIIFSVQPIGLMISFFVNQIILTLPVHFSLFEIF